MRFNKKALQRQLDISAQELDEKGYVDLSDKVDKVNEEIMELDETNRGEINEVRATLNAISKEADRRDKKTAPRRGRRRARRGTKTSLKTRAKARAKARMLARVRARKAKTPRASTAKKIAALSLRVKKLEKLLEA